MMKVIIAGGRKFDDFNFLCQTIDLLPFQITEVVCGGAKGADTLGRHWAKLNNIPVKMFMADWNRFGKSAGYIRNAEMADYADYLVAFWDKESKGTGHMIDLMDKKKPNSKLVALY